MLLKSTVKTIPWSDCNSTLLEYNQGKDLATLRNGINENQYCAYNPNGTSENVGYSGGPLQIIDSESAKIVGVLSFNAGTWENRLPTVYSRVASYLDWIESLVWPNGIVHTPLVSHAI